MTGRRPARQLVLLPASIALVLAVPTATTLSTSTTMSTSTSQPTAETLQPPPALAAAPTLSTTSRPTTTAEPTPPATTAPPTTVASTTTTEPAKPERVALVGDSITWEHQTLIENELATCGAPQVTIDALPGRMATTSSTPIGSIPSGFDAIEKLESRLDPTSWIIELGINDVNAGAAVDEAEIVALIDGVLERVAGDDVTWVAPWTAGQNGPVAAQFTDILTRYDIDVIDWPQVAETLVYDGLHPTEAGAIWLGSEYCAAFGWTGRDFKRALGGR